MMDRADMQKMREAYEAYRQQILKDLSPSSRALLAKVVGNLAIADNPDRKTAVEQLDAGLSASEKSAILADAKQFRDQMRAKWQSAHPGATPPSMHMNGKKHEPHAPDAGMILLSLDGHGMMMGGGWRQPKR